MRDTWVVSQVYEQRVSGKGLSTGLLTAGLLQDWFHLTSSSQIHFFSSAIYLFSFSITTSTNSTCDTFMNIVVGQLSLLYIVFLSNVIICHIFFSWWVLSWKITYITSSFVISNEKLYRIKLNCPLQIIIFTLNNWY